GCVGARYVHVAGIFTLEHGCGAQPLGYHRGHVLERVHRDVSATIEHCGVDFLREQPPVADHRQRHISDAISGSLHDLDLDDDTGMQCAQSASDVIRLPQCECAAPGRDPDCQCNLSSD